MLSAKFTAGQVVTALDCAYIRPTRAAVTAPSSWSRARATMRIRGCVDGHAVHGLAPGGRYRVEAVLPNGGLRLEGFTFTVSPAHVARVLP